MGSGAGKCDHREDKEIKESPEVIKEEGTAQGVLCHLCGAIQEGGASIQDEGDLTETGATPRL